MDIIEDLKKLSTTELAIVKIVAIYGQSITRTEIVNSLNKLDLQAEGVGRFSVAKLTPIIKACPYLFMQTSKNHVTIDKELSTEISLYCYNNEEYQTIADSINYFYTSYPRANSSRELYVSVLRYSIFIGNYSIADELVDDRPTGSGWNSFAVDSTVLNEIIPLNRFRTFADNLDEDERSSLIDVFLSIADTFEYMEILIGYSSLFYLAIDDDWDRSSFLLEYLLLRGNYDEIERIFSKNNGVLQIVKAFKDINSGSYDSATKLLDSSRKIIRKVNEDSTIFFGGIIGIMQILLLMRDDSAKSIKYLNAIINKLDKIPFLNYSAIDIIRKYRIFQEGNKSVFESVDSLSKEILENNFYDNLLLILISNWVKRPLSEVNKSELIKISINYGETGYYWLAFQLLSALKQDNNNSNDWTPIIALHGAVDSWEMLIKQLTQLGDNKAISSQPTQAGTKRICWIIRNSEEETIIYPIEQSLGKNGKWSKGRNVALSKLFKEKEAPEYFTSQDRDIVNTIRKDEYYTGWGYPEVKYIVDPFKAIPFLKDHSQLFYEEDRENPITIRELSPQIDVTEKADDIIVTINPYPRANRNLLFLICDSGDIEFYRFSSSQKQIAKLLTREGAVFPKTAKAEVNRTISHLADKIAVTGKVSSNDSAIKTEKCVTKPTVRIRPAAFGVSAEIVIIPKSSSTLIFKPGIGNSEILTADSSGKIRIVRNLKKEIKLLNEIIELCPSLQFDGDVESGWFFDDTILSLQFIRELKAIEKKVNVEWPKGESIKLGREIDTKDVRIKVGGTNNWLELDSEVMVDVNRVISLQELIDANKSGSNFVNVADDFYISLTDSLKKQIEQLSSLVQTRKGVLGVNPLAALSVESFFGGSELTGNTSLWNNFVKNYREAISKTPKVPVGFNGELREYQVDGFSWLSRLASAGIGACLADDMGLGKTIQALALLQERASSGAALIIAPTSLCRNWADEAARFTPGLKVSIIGDENRKDVIENAGVGDLIFCSYGLLVNEEKLITDKLWHTLILDEAQAIKNISAKRSKIAKKINADFRMIATGTPIENHLGELWNLMDFLNPGVLGSFELFRKRFVTGEDGELDKKANLKLRNLIKPFILRRLKGDVLNELPPKTETLLTVTLTEDERNVYEAVRTKAIRDLEEGDTDSNQKFTILSHIMKLRRACCNSSLVTKEKTDLSSSKLTIFAQKLGELRDNGHRALVFSQFVDHLSILRDFCDSKGIIYKYLDGSTPVAERKKRVDSFQMGEGELFLISLKAGGVGLNLTAADYVFIMDPWWNPAVEDQAADRSHRIGQENPVTIYRIVAANTIEEKIVKLHSRKRSMADSLLEGTDTATALSDIELLELISGE